MALRAGLIEMVKASIPARYSAISCLVSGIALFAGGTQVQGAEVQAHLPVGMSSTVLLIAVFGLVVPALFHGLHPDRSEWRPCACRTTSQPLLIAGYVAWLGFSLGPIFGGCH